MNAELPGIMVARDDGRVIGQCPVARGLVGVVNGRTCGEVMGCTNVPGGAGCPPAEGREIVRGRNRFELRCARVDGLLVSMLQPVEDSGRAEWERLTPREVEVLGLLAEGLTTSEIAARLGISDATVRAHVEHMRVRLGVSTRAALVARGFRLNYIH